MAADDELGKAVSQVRSTPVTKESSRWHTGGPGHFPSFSTQKMQRMAASGLGEMHAMEREVSRISRTQPENRTGPLERHVITLDDVTRGLGLDIADEQRLQRLVNDTLPTFTQKTQTQRIMHARGRLTSVLRDSMKHVDSDTRMEVIRRAVAYWKRHYQTDYGKVPTIRHRGVEARKSMGPKLVISIETLLKGAGPFIGPHGGKWADAAHTKAWSPQGTKDEKIAHHKKKAGEWGKKATAHQSKAYQAAWDKKHRGKNVKGGKGLFGIGAYPPRPRDGVTSSAHRSPQSDGARDVANAHATAASKLIETPKARKEAAAASKRRKVKQEAVLERQRRQFLILKADSKKLDDLEKAGARGGKYFKRVPTGKPKRPYRYYYTKEAYERDHGTLTGGGFGGHLPGFEMKRARALAKLKKQVSGEGVKTKDALDNIVLAAEAQRLWVKAPDFGLPAQTIHKYAKDTGRKNQFGETIREYTKARTQKHNAIIEAATRKVSRVPVSQKPVAIVMMGGGGAGKGTLLKAIVHNHGDFVHVDPDDVKGHLPEYQKAMNLGSIKGTPVTAKDAAWMAHEESSDIAEKILAQGMSNRQNVIVDGTGKNAQKHADKIKALKKAGYHVKLLYAHTEMDEAIKRAATRADGSGRYVPLPVLKDAHTKIPGNFEFVARHADEFALFRSERPPKKLWTYPPDTVHDKAEVREFKALGKRLHAERGITLPPIPADLMPGSTQQARAVAKSLDAFFVIQALRKGAGKPPSLSMDDMLKRIADNYHNYPLATTPENATEGGEDLLRREAEKMRGERLIKALPSHYVRLSPLRLEW